MKQAEIEYFEPSTHDAWRSWLRDNHAAKKAVWLVFWKKHTGKTVIEYRQALEEALCYGWIDSIIKRLDEDRCARKFTPRTNVDKRSDTNIALVKQLIKDKRMTPAGLAKIGQGILTKPKATRTELTLAPDMLRMLKAEKNAWKHFSELTPSYRRNYVGWVMSAKRPETRSKRMLEAITFLVKGKSLD